MRPILASTLMLSSFIIPAAAQSSKPADDATAQTPAARVSTGITPPKLAKPITVPMPEGIASAFVPSDQELELSFTVDTQGKAENVKVVKPVNPYWDARIVEEIERSHFKPATLDNQAVPMDMNLIVSAAK